MEWGCEDDSLEDDHNGDSDFDFQDDDVDAFHERWEIPLIMIIVMMETLMIRNGDDDFDLDSEDVEN